MQKRGNMDADGDDDGEGLADLGETLEAKVKALGLDGGAGGGADPPRCAPLSRAKSLYYTLPAARAR